MLTCTNKVTVRIFPEVVYQVTLNWQSSILHALSFHDSSTLNCVLLFQEGCEEKQTVKNILTTKYHITLSIFYKKQTSNDKTKVA